MLTLLVNCYIIEITESWPSGRRQQVANLSGQVIGSKSSNLLFSTNGLFLSSTAVVALHC